MQQVYQRPKFSFLVLDYYNEDGARRCLESIKQNNLYNYPVIYLDNGAFDKDEVIVKILKKVSLTAGSVVKVIKHNTTHAIGTINYVKNSLRVKFDDEKLNNYRSKVVNIDEFTV